jgi:phosphatidylglycerol:prolipoprotein diacylglycerol transferase
MIAAILGGGSLVWLLRQAGYTAQRTAGVFAALAVALLIGSKLLFLFEWGLTAGGATTGLLHAVLSPQMRIPGGFLLAVAIGPLLAGLLGVRYFAFADTIVPAAGLLICGIRIGCFLEGCCFGHPSSLPWAASFPPYTEVFGWQVNQQLIPLSAPATLPVHPLQLYFAVVGVVIFLGLTWYQRRKRYEGEVLLLFLLSYLWSTWALELMRARPHGLTRDLVLGCALAVSVIPFAVGRRMRSRQRGATACAR